MVFKGATGNANNKQEFEMKPHIVYPMDGGTALITFEEEVGEFLPARHWRGSDLSAFVKREQVIRSYF